MKQSTNHIPTILIIDRDQDDCQLLKEAILEVSPLTEVILWEGEDSMFELMEKVQPSLIFIEYRLPGESGVERVQRLKSHPVYRSIPVVMWSTGSIGTIMKETCNACVQLFMEKPWEIEQWTERVKIVVDQHLQPGPAFLHPAPGAISVMQRKADISCQADEALALQVA